MKVKFLLERLAHIILLTVNVLKIKLSISQHSSVQCVKLVWEQYFNIISGLFYHFLAIKDQHNLKNNINKSPDALVFYFPKVSKGS